jgi:GT2 family glycosyltransferase
MVNVLAALFKLAHENDRIAAVGPLLIDESTELPLPFFSYRYGRKERITPVESDNALEVDFLVSSGTLLAMDAIAEVGLMREELFISYVDVEWCLRSRSRGYRILGCCATSMVHNLGERRLKIGRYIIPLHSPLRHYYLLRSGVYMQRLNYVSRVWKRADRRQLVRSFIFFSIADFPRLQEFLSMLRGIKDGLSIKIKSPIYIKNIDIPRERLEVSLGNTHDHPAITRVAVLMAIYSGDTAELFEQALLSVLCQTLPDNYDLRIYLGIDGSIPCALEDVVAAYQSRFYLVSKSTINLGLACTLNRLIKLRGDETFFFRMDADDVSLPGRFAAQLDYLRKNPGIDVLGTAIWECSSNGMRRLIRFAKGPEDAIKRIDRRVPVAHPTVCMHRRVLDNTGGYPERRGNEDISMWIKCIEAGFRFDNLPEPWLNFTVNDSFWRRRSFHKAFSEFQSYVEGIYRLHGLTWRYVFPLARLMLRISPEWVSRRIYNSSLRN